jgi:hypothetical protein
MADQGLFVAVEAIILGICLTLILLGIYVWRHRRHG